jgi:hypothetical protein
MIGRPTKIVDTFGRAYDAHYEVINVNFARPVREFVRRDMNIEEKDVRNYQASLDFKPELLVNEALTPYSGPPVLLPDGRILAGDSRTWMARNLRDQGRYTIYTDFLAPQSDEYGIPASWLGDKRYPFLVRCMDTELTPREQIRFARLANITVDDYRRFVDRMRADTTALARLISRIRFGPGEGVAEAMRRPENMDLLRREAQRVPWDTLIGMVQRGPKGLELTPVGAKRIMLVRAAGILTDPAVLLQMAEEF